VGGVVVGTGALVLGVGDVVVGSGPLVLGVTAPPPVVETDGALVV